MKSELAQGIPVDDVRGFEHVLVSGGKGPGGKMEPVSEAHPALIYIGAIRHTLVGVKRDAQNVSTAPNGRSGTLILKGLLHESILGSGSAASRPLQTPPPTSALFPPPTTPITSAPSSSSMRAEHVQRR